MSKKIIFLITSSILIVLGVSGYHYLPGLNLKSSILTESFVCSKENYNNETAKEEYQTSVTRHASLPKEITALTATLATNNIALTAKQTFIKTIQKTISDSEAKIATLRTCQSSQVNRRCKREKKEIKKLQNVISLNKREIRRGNRDIFQLTQISEQGTTTLRALNVELKEVTTGVDSYENCGKTLALTIQGDIPAPDISTHYIWTVAANEWTACSVTCGGGTQQSPVYKCKEEVSGTLVDDSHCVGVENTLGIPSQTQVCNIQACPVNTCTNGATNHPTCTLCPVGNTLQSGQCQDTPPVNCGTITHGNTETRKMYSALSVPFGQSCEATPENVVTQTKTCTNGTLSDWAPTTTFTNTTCAVAREIIIPPTTQDNYIWTASDDYTTCSVTCGAGTQTQVYLCRKNGDTIVDDSFCSVTTKPAPTKVCNLGVCSVTTSTELNATTVAALIWKPEGTFTIPTGATPQEYVVSKDGKVWLMLSGTVTIDTDPTCPIGMTFSSCSRSWPIKRVMNGIYYISKDFGKTWTKVDITTTFDFQSADISDDGRVIELIDGHTRENFQFWGNNNVYISRDNGVTWSKSPLKGDLPMVSGDGKTIMTNEKFLQETVTSTGTRIIEKNKPGGEANYTMSSIYYSRNLEKYFISHSQAAQQGQKVTSGDVNTTAQFINSPYGRSTVGCFIDSPNISRTGKYAYRRMCDKYFLTKNFGQTWSEIIFPTQDVDIFKVFSDDMENLTLSNPPTIIKENLTSRDIFYPTPPTGEKSYGLLWREGAKGYVNGGVTGHKLYRSAFWTPINDFEYNDFSITSHYGTRHFPKDIGGGKIAYLYLDTENIIHLYKHDGTIWSLTLPPIETISENLRSSTLGNISHQLSQTNTKITLTVLAGIFVIMIGVALRRRKKRETV